jgi:hypothetical protein
MWVASLIPVRYRVTNLKISSAIRHVTMADVRRCTIALDGLLLHHATEVFFLPSARLRRIFIEPYEMALTFVLRPFTGTLSLRATPMELVLLPWSGLGIGHAVP